MASCLDKGSCWWEAEKQASESSCPSRLFPEMVPGVFSSVHSAEGSLLPFPLFSWISGTGPGSLNLVKEERLWGWAEAPLGLQAVNLAIVWGGDLRSRIEQVAWPTLPRPSWLYANETKYVAVPRPPHT